jgi:hypothetical protein
MNTGAVSSTAIILIFKLSLRQVQRKMPHRNLALKSRIFANVMRTKDHAEMFIEVIQNW